MNERPLLILMAYWDSVIVLEENAEILPVEYLEAA